MSLELTLLAGGIIALALFLLYLFRTFRIGNTTCPKCGSMHPDRVRRSNLMRLIPCKAYRCHNCGKRFYQIHIDNDVVIAS
ncbi:hypothetical protein GO730_11880 [Spirosoma sp. HMF3257]|uniref:hypothetical protein n=1 Tax=Spirosoma telluris TaxID=2183553 RepID=UPI0011B940C0|nr:hypothetical protein [Spirosoma telluris]